MFVVISGVIGCGKSTLVQGLQAAMGATPFYEPLPETDNFMLEAYYKDPKRYAYSMQTLLLALRFQSHQEAQWRSMRGELCVQDSSIYNDKAFLDVQKRCGYIDALEYRAYEKLCEIHFPFLQYPDLHLHIDLPLDTEVERIKERSRDCEAGIDVTYLQMLGEAYDDLIPHLEKLYPVVRLDGSKGKKEVLADAITAIRARMDAMKKEASGYPVYKKNQAYAVFDGAKA